MGIEISILRGIVALRTRPFAHALDAHKNLCSLRLVDFEYDGAKSAANAFKHGIDFSSARRLWGDAALLILPSKFPDEPRYLAIGQIEGVAWTAVFTERKERIRLISVRRSRENERDLYEQNQPR